jgi:hypothetical protein
MNIMTTRVPESSINTYGQMKNEDRSAIRLL